MNFSQPDSPGAFYVLLEFFFFCASLTGGRFDEFSQTFISCSNGDVK